MSSNESDTESLAAARRARAKRWASIGLHGYPALAEDDETEATLASAPPAKAEKPPKPPTEGAA